MTPDYIENRFGKFGKPTMKQQLIISNKKREDISIKDEPNKVLPIDELITDKLVGEKLDVLLSTKQRGQQLERMVAYQLGYKGL